MRRIPYFGNEAPAMGKLREIQDFPAVLGIWACTDGSGSAGAALHWYQDLRLLTCVQGCAGGGPAKAGPSVAASCQQLGAGVFHQPLERRLRRRRVVRHEAHEDVQLGRHVLELKPAR